MSLDLSASLSTVKREARKLYPKHKIIVVSIPAPGDYDGIISITPDQLPAWKRREREKTKENLKRERSFRKDLVDKQWMRHWKAASKNGSPAELQRLVVELSNAVERFRAFKLSRPQRLFGERHWTEEK